MTRGAWRRGRRESLALAAAVLGSGGVVGAGASSAAAHGVAATAAMGVAAAPAIGVAAVPASVRQGRTLLVRIAMDESAVAANAPLTVLARFGPAGVGEATPLRVFPATDDPAETHHLALAGVPVDAAPGAWEVTADTRVALDPDTPLATETVDVAVVDGDFPAQRIAFAGDLLSLLDPAVGEEEWLTLATVIASSDGTSAARWHGRFRLPVSGRLVTAHGARRDYLDPEGRVVARWQHGGIDVAVPAGTPIASPAAGVVAFAGRWRIRGNAVVLAHGAGVHTVHAHAAQLAVAAGQAVVPGQVLGWVGSTGLSTGPHLHWEVRVGSVAVDPLEWTQREELGLA